MARVTIKTKKAADKSITFALVVLVVIAINILAFNLPLSFDITKNGMQTLSSGSKRVVRELTEPFTVKVFLSKNLPAHYSLQEKRVRDTLDQYRRANRRMFRYEYVDVDAFPEQAEEYGVAQVQIQALEEGKLVMQNAFVSAVLLQGDSVEVIPNLLMISLEYEITGRIKKIAERVNTIANLSSPIEFTLYLPSATQERLDAVSVVSNIRVVVDDLAKQYLGRVSFTLNEGEAPAEIPVQRALTMQEGLAMGFSLAAEGETNYFSLLSQNLFQLTIVSPEQIIAIATQAIDDMIGVNKKIGIVTDGDLYDYAAQFQGQGASPEAYSFMSQIIASGSYQITTVSLDEEIPRDITALFVLDPKDELSEAARYRLDQFVMSGKPVAFAIAGLDFVEQPPEGMDMFGRPQRVPPRAVPHTSGVESLLAHYGVRVNNDIVNDVRGLTLRGQNGDLVVYSYPDIDQSTIMRDDPITESIYRFVMFDPSSIESIPENLIEGAKYEALAKTSPSAWTGSEGALPQLHSGMLPLGAVPPADADVHARDLVAKRSGAFTSYFADRPRPALAEDAKEGVVDIEAVTFKPAVDNGLVYVIGSAAFFRNQTIMTLQDMIGRYGNEYRNYGVNYQRFVQNFFDSMAMDTDLLAVRNKIVYDVPLRVNERWVRLLVAGLNTFGLPFLLIVCGLVLWALDRKRRNRLRVEFEQR